MLDEPYRWVEAMHNRREYLEDQLRHASPVVGLCYERGIALLTTTPGPRKLFEVYNQVAFAAIGHPADIEKLRKAVIDIAHLEAFNLSAGDVSLQRLVHFGLGPIEKAAFDEIFRSPYIARVMVAELDPDEAEETFYTVDADGSFASAARAAALAGTPESTALIARRLEAVESEKLALAEALALALKAWGAGSLAAEHSEEECEPGEEEVGAFLKEALAAQRLEAAVLDRSLPTKTKFHPVDRGELEALAAPYTA